MNVLSVFLACALVGLAQTPPPVPVVTLPAAPPLPAPNPALPTTLSQNMLYVVNSTGPVTVLASPEGIVKITSDTGPLRIRGLFVDGTKTETKTFKGPNVYIIEAASLGTCELVIVPSMDPATVIRRTLVTGPAPTPVPPTPVPPPGPAPPAPTPVDPAVSAMIAAFKSDGATATQASQLASVCRTMAAATTQTATTYSDVFSAFSPLADAIIGKTTTPAIHNLIGNQLMQAFGSAASPVDKVLAAKTFNAIASQLEGVK